MPNPFFYLARKFLNKTASKPINSPFSLGQTVLNELAECKRRLAELEKPREVVTHYEGDHELLETAIRTINQHADIIKAAQKIIHAHDNRFRELEAAPISKKLREITSQTAKAKPRRKANGQFVGRHAAT